jgi:hypothetical protein
LEGEQEKMRKLRRLGVAGGAALLAAALIAPQGVAQANTHTVTDQYGAAASSQVVDLHLLGRHVSFGAADVTSTLDAVTKQVNAEAKGLGTLLVPASQAIARFNDPASVNKACALPQVEQITGMLSGTASSLPALPLVGDLLGGGQLTVGGLLPSIDVNVGCAEANVGGNADSFLAESVGGLLQVHVKMPAVISNLVGTVRGTLNGITGQGGDANVLGLPVGDVLGNVPVMDTVNGLLGNVLGGGLLQGLPVANTLNLESLTGTVLNPTETVDGLLQSIEQGDILKIDLGVSTARNAGDLQSYISQAVSEGGAIDLLPNFLGSGKSLLKINILKSSAKVAVDRTTMQVMPEAAHTTVRIESALLPDLGLAGLPIVGDVLGTTGLPVVDSVVPMVNGLLGGVPVADDLLGGLLGLDATVKGLGLTMGDGYIELGPGMAVSLLCDGIVAPLCTEISVGAAHDPTTTADGRTRVESSAVTIHLLKGLNDLTGQLPIVGGLPVISDLMNSTGLNLGTILGNGGLGVGNIVSGLLGSAGLNIGEPSDVPGIKISLAHAVAEAGGTKVMGAAQEAPRSLDPVASAPVAAPALPRTGGLPVDATAIPVLLGASAGLRGLARRRRRNA